MPASCSEHSLSAEDHCIEIEDMLQQIPGDFCEGEGDSPADAVCRFRAAYDEAVGAVAKVHVWLTHFGDQLSEHAYQELESAISDVPAPPIGGGT